MRLLLIISVFIFISLSAYVMWSLRPQSPGYTVASDIALCGGMPNGSNTSSTDGSHISLLLPKKYYFIHDDAVQITTSGSLHVSVAPNTLIGRAPGETPSCWSTEYVFDGVGTVQFFVPREVRGASDYSLTVVVANSY